MIILSLVVVGAASYFQLGVDRFPLGRPAHRHRAHDACPAPLRRRWSRSVSQPIEEAVNTVEGIERAALGLRRRAARSSSPPSTSSRDIDAAAQDVRDRVAGVVARPAAATSTPPVVRQVRQRHHAGADDRALRRPAAARADRDRRQDRQGAARARRPASARSRSSAASSARSTSGSTPTGWPPTRSPSRPCATPFSGQNADVPGGNVDLGRARVSAAHPGPLHRRARLQRSGDRDASTARRSASRDIGHAEDGTKEQRSLARLNGVPTVTLEVRRQSGRQHRRGDRGRQGELEQRARRACPPT